VRGCQMVLMLVKRRSAMGVHAALGITRQARCWGGPKATAWAAQVLIAAILGDDLQIDVRASGCGVVVARTLDGERGEGQLVVGGSRTGAGRLVGMEWRGPMPTWDGD